MLFRELLRALVCSLVAIGLAANAMAAASRPVGDTWTIDSGEIDPHNYFGETVANGVLGILSMPVPFRTKKTLIAGAYEPDQARGVEVIVEPFALLNLDLTVDGDRVERLDQVSDFRQSMDMKRAAFTTTFSYQDKATIRYSIRALRQLPFNAMMDVTVFAKRPITVSVGTHLDASAMLGAVQSVVAMRIHGGHQMIAVSADTASGKLKVAAAQTVLFEDSDTPHVERQGDGLDFSKSLAGDSTFRFTIVGATTTSAHTSNPLAEAKRLTILAAVQGTRELIAAHESAWGELWEGDIVIEGDDSAQRDVRSMLYHLYSFVREGTGYSIGPMGLSDSGYSGHIFWDADLWMLPPLLALHPELAKSMLDYRFARLDAARRNALARGHRGAMFPWESSASGDEDTPVAAMSGALEIHVTACVGLAAWNYYRVTQNLDWLQAEGYPLIEGTADFWASRVTRSDTGSYDIRHVVAADEFAVNVDNDAFTNAAARANLAAATAAARILGKAPKPAWTHVEANLPVLQFANGTTREHATYNGEEIKQADAILLSYPLEAITASEPVRRDLEYYAARTHKNGPAMTKSITALLYERLGLPEKAYATFEDGLAPNKRPPFGVLSESANSKNPYFATGAGGFLQSMLFGFAGLNITDGGITQRSSKLPAQWKSLTVRGVGPTKHTYAVR